MIKSNALSNRFQIAFVIFMAALAFLGRNNPNLEYPQVFYLFFLLMVLNLTASVALRLKPTLPSLSAAFIMANCGVITAILAYSGGASSGLWVLYFLPIFTVCLLLGTRETAWITAGVVCFDAAFTVSQSQENDHVIAFEVLLKSGLFILTAVLAWRLASREKDARSRLQVESRRADQLTARLEGAAALSNIGLVSAGVAHDLRISFMAVLGFAEMALQNEALGLDVREMLERIVRMSRLGGEMAQHITRHGADARFEPVDDDLNSIASGMAALVKNAYLSKNALLEVSASPKPCPVHVSRVHIQRLFLNLLLNALSVTEAGKKVRMTIQNEAGQAIMTIEDEGPGFSSEILNHLFEPYGTTRADNGGTGLGLNLCARIARQHDGDLLVENRSEGGAKLTLRLPLKITS